MIDPTIALFEMQFRPASEPADADGTGHRARCAWSCASNWSVAACRRRLRPWDRRFFSTSLEIIGALHRAGVPIVAGTDQTVPGFSVYREIELYQQAGFTPLEALQAATIVPARAMKVDADSGSIEVGKRADLDVLDANPLDNIHNVRSVRMVVANGVLYDPKPLWESVGFKPE